MPRREKGPTLRRDSDPVGGPEERGGQGTVALASLEGALCTPFEPTAVT